MGRFSRLSGSSKEPPKLVGIGDIAPDFDLCDVQGNKYKLSSFRGRRVLLSFCRFAACPLCQYSLDRMRRQSDMLARAGVVTISIFNSRPEHIAMFASPKVGDDVIALSDKKGSVYSSFQVKKSSLSAFYATLDMATNYGKFRPYVNITGVWKDFGGNPSIARQQPADFMINESGEIVDLFRAENLQDHMPFERIEAFLPEDKRCRCNKMDCISPRCRHEYEEIRKESEAGIFLG